MNARIPPREYSGLCRKRWATQDGRFTLNFVLNILNCSPVMDTIVNVEIGA